MFDRAILEYLNQWKNKANRKPLILRGARQVGKTSVVKLFARQSFSELVYINLEQNNQYELFKKIQTIEDFKKTIQIVFKKNLIAGETLVFIDEIQNLPNIISLLRFFYEQWPELHLVAAGSLLEVKIKHEGFSLPVGRVEYAYVYPLTFFEFLNAKQENNLLGFLKKIKLGQDIPEAIHIQAIKLFQEYALIGGMPEVVSLHLQNTSQEEINTLYSSLMTAYAEDAYKYSSQANVPYLKHVIENAPYFAGERFTYVNFAESQYKSREMAQAFNVLEQAMIVNQIMATKSNELPLLGQKKRAKKLLYLDSGFVNFKNNIQAKYINLDDLNNLYRGKIAEQIVGQNIIANFVHSTHSVFYWSKEKPQASAEVDFCLAFEGKIWGIEVKSGHSAKLKSLFSFATNVKDHKLVRIYSGLPKQEQVVYNQKNYQLLSVPFYLVNRLFDL